MIILFADIIPNAVEDFGSEIGNAWPIFLAISAIIALAWRAQKYLNKTLNEAMDDKIDPIIHEICNMKYELTTNGGNSMKDMLISVDRKVHEIARNYQEMRVAIQTFIEINDRAMYRANEEGVTVQANQAYLDFWGFESLEEAASEDWMEYLVDRELAERRLGSIIENPRDFIYESDMKDGRRLRVIGHPIEVNGEFLGYVGYVLDAKEANLEVEIFKVEDQLEDLKQRVIDHVEWEENLKYPPDVEGFMAAPRQKNKHTQNTDEEE